MHAKSGKRLAGASCLALWLLMFGATHSLGAAAYRYQDLGTLTASYFSWAGGINDHGQVVGYSGTKCADGNYEPHAVLAAAGGPMEDLGTLAGGMSIADGYISGANGLNSSGQVVGWSAATLPDGTFVQHAIIKTATGAMQDLGTLGGSTAGATAINDSGQVVGWASTILPGGAPEQHAFLWTAAAGMQDLGTLGGGTSGANGINHSSQVVGWSLAAGGVQHAFVWTTAAGMGDLNNLVINPPPGDFLSDARAINTRGQIAGNTNKGRAFLLTPISTMPPIMELLLID
ncbi:MAG: hypothetical protein AB1424_09210 [Thermodesulfobacteriota bacterium]